MNDNYRIELPSLLWISGNSNKIQKVFDKDFVNPTTLHKMLADLEGHYHCYLMIQFQIPKKANVCTCVMYSREKKMCIDQGPTDRAIIHARYIMMYQR